MAGPRATNQVVRRRTGSVIGNVPAELSSFVGRQDELTQVKRLLSTYRMVTLTGVGGVGKTRLALRTATEVRRAFPDGAWFIDLGGVLPPELATFEMPDAQAVAGLVCATLGVREQSARAPVDALRERLARARLLLVLDNCEHLLSACAMLAEALLRASPGLRIVATSREPLTVVGEATLPVPPLPVPDRHEPPALADLTRCASVALFTARATAALHDFQLTEDNRLAVVEICQRLDGLPLAIELAAARLPVLTPHQIADRLIDRFALLTRSSRRSPDRQQTLRACVDWSFDLCTKDEQRLWARLSTFADSFEFDAIEGICASDDLPVEELLDLTNSLVDKSILVRNHDHGRSARYRMLQTMQVYGLEKLRETGEDAFLARRHRDWYEGLVARARAEWISNRQAYWLTRLTREYPNLRAAVDFSLREPGEVDAALRIALSLPAMYWWARGMFREGRRWLKIALGATTERGVRHTRAMLLASRLAFAQRDGDASRLLEDGERLARRLDAPDAIAQAMFIRGTAAMFRNELALAVELFEAALATLDRAAEPELDQRLHVMFTLVAAAGLAGDHARASACYREVLAITEPNGEGIYRSNAMWAHGMVAWRQGDLDEAAALQLASLRLKCIHGLDDTLGGALCLEVLGWIEAGQQRPDRAATFLGAADAALEDLGTPIRTFGHLAEQHDECERQTRNALGDRIFDETLRHGRGLTYEEALAYALGEVRSAPPATSAAPTPLTRRQQQVAMLVGRGLSNREIASALVISQRTAESHLESILTRLGFSSRAQVAAWMARQHPDG
ncbi:ATP-binding protein [Virgisporangium aurantiacum]|nr:LuxR C-terminal-related transcriptional regulator [Virgisporangium aurantiacum]